MFVYRDKQLANPAKAGDAKLKGLRVIPTPASCQAVHACPRRRSFAPSKKGYEMSTIQAPRVPHKRYSQQIKIAIALLLFTFPFSSFGNELLFFSTAMNALADYAYTIGVRG